MELKEVDPEPDYDCSVGLLGKSKANNSAGSCPDSPSHRNLIRTLRKVQRWSAYGIVGFAGLHLTSTIILPPLNINIANSAFMAARSIYQFEIGEYALVYGAMGLHVTSGIALHVMRILKNRADYGIWGWGKPSWVAINGVILAVATGWHWLTMRLGPLKALGDSSLISLEYVSFGLQDHTWGSTSCLGLLSLLFFVHTVPAACQYLRIKMSSLKRWLVIMLGISWTTASLRVLYKQPAVTGWMADQFKSAYQTYMHIFSV